MIDKVKNNTVRDTQLFNHTSKLSDYIIPLRSKFSTLCILSEHHINEGTNIKKRINNNFFTLDHSITNNQFTKDQAKVSKELGSKKSDFVTEYRSNLLKTVYKETYIASKRKNKAKNRQYKMQSVYSPNERKYGNTIKGIEKMRNFSYNQIIQSRPLETLKKLQTSKKQLPLIAKKHKIQAMNEIFDMLPIVKVEEGQQILREKTDKQTNSRLIHKRNKSKNLNQRQQIKPWETFHDQFLD